MNVKRFLIPLILLWCLGCQATESGPAGQREDEQPLENATTSATTASPATAAAGAAQIEPWRVVRQMQVERSVSFAAFHNPDVGIRGCSSNTRQHVYRTLDGGQTWVESDDPLG